MPNRVYELCSPLLVCVFIHRMMPACRGRQEVEEKLEAELRTGLDSCVAEVTALVAPLGEATAAAVARLRDAEARRAELAQQLEALKQRAAAVE